MPRQLTVPDAERIARKRKRRRRRWERQQRAAAEQPVRVLEGYSAVPSHVAMLAPSFASKTGTDSYDDEEDYILDEESSSGMCIAVVLSCMYHHAAPLQTTALQCCQVLLHAVALCYNLHCAKQMRSDAMSCWYVQMSQMMSRKQLRACPAHASQPAWSSRLQHTYTETAGESSIFPVPQHYMHELVSAYSHLWVILSMCPALNTGNMSCSLLS